MMSQLRRIRKSKGFSQKSLAKAAGISQSLLSDIENGKVNPTLNVIIKLAKALNTPLIKLLDEKNIA